MYKKFIADTQSTYWLLIGLTFSLLLFLWRIYAPNITSLTINSF